MAHLYGAVRLYVNYFQAVVNERWVTPVDKIEWLASGFEAAGYTLSQSGQSAAAVVLWSALIAETVRLVVVLAGFLKKDLDRKLNERSDKRLRKRLDKARKEGAWRAVMKRP